MNKDKIPKKRIIIDKMVKKRLRIDFSEGSTSLERDLATELSFHKDTFQVSDIPSLYLFYHLHLIENLYELENLKFKLDQLEANLTEEAMTSGYKTNEKTRAFIRRDREWVKLKSEVIKQETQVRYMEGIVTAFVIKADIAKMFQSIPHDGNIPVREILDKIVHRTKNKVQNRKKRR